MRRPLLFLVTSLLFFCATPAQADDKSQARARFREGVVAFDHGDYEAARASFLQAYAIRPHPDVMLNLGWSCLRAGRRDEAESWFARYLDEAKDAPDAKRRDAERGLADARTRGVTTSSTTVSSASVAQAMKEDVAREERDEAASERDDAPSTWLLDGMLGAGDSDLGAGLGVRAARTMVGHLRLGGALVWHFGHSFTRRVNGVTSSGSTAGLYLGPEVGWDFVVGRGVVVRPYAGVGAAFMSSTVTAGVRSTESDVRAVVWPGGAIEWTVPGTAFAIGGDLRLVSIPGGPALSAFVTAGARL